MNTDSKIQFFGKVTASLSHDIKNAIAIINENAGLLEDLALLTKRGVPFDEERIEKLASDMQHQVDRADQIIKRLNVFAHTTDSQEIETNLSGTLVLFTELFKRTASIKGIECSVDEDSKELSIVSDPFVILYAIWELVEHLSNYANGQADIRLAASQNQDGDFISMLTSFSIVSSDINPEQFTFLKNPLFRNLIVSDNSIRLFITTK